MMWSIYPLEAEVVGQRKVADESFVLSLEAPPIAKMIRPGQFIQIRCTRKDDPLLPRPFSIYRVRDQRILDILYEVVGRGTKLLAETKKGERLNLFGPLGNIFSYPRGKTVSFLVGGGAGLAPFYDLAEALVDPKRGRQKRGDVIVLLGVRNREKIFCEKDFKSLGIRFEIATDDGSYGFKGFVTELLEKFLRTTHDARRMTRIYACGPKPMLRAIAHSAEKWKIPCEVSIDAYMPCGYGICFGCAVKVQTKDERPKTKDSNGGNLSSYKLACTDGPVFNAQELIWD